MKALFLTFAISLTFNCYAATPPFGDFQSLYESVLQNCAYDCEGEDFVSQYFYESGSVVQPLSAEVFSALNVVAQNQANVWGDTIYEGPYMASDEVELTSIEGIYYRGQLVMYRITYAQSAWATETCDVDWDEEEPSFEDCEEGVIRETSLVSMDFKEYEIDGDKYADYND